MIKEIEIKSDVYLEFGLVNSTIQKIKKINRIKIFCASERNEWSIMLFRKPERCDVNEALLKWFNPLTPNDPYSCRTAPLTSKVAFYIFIHQI